MGGAHAPPGRTSVRRGGPIERRTQLRPSGRRGARLEADRARNRALAMERGNRCQGCGQYGYVEGAHAFGRGNQISEPMASWEACYVCLCRKCHHTHDNGSGAEHERLKQKVGWIAVVALMQTEEVLDAGITLPMTVGDTRWRPLDAARHLERELKRVGAL